MFPPLGQTRVPDDDDDGETASFPALGQGGVPGRVDPLPSWCTQPPAILCATLTNCELYKAEQGVLSIPAEEKQDVHCEVLMQVY